MDQPAAKASMMRFEPESGWRDAGEPAGPLNEIAENNTQQAPPDLHLSAEALISVGESIQDIFNSLKINDPRLQVWTQVHSAIRLIGGKLQEKKSLEARLVELNLEIEGTRALACELVVDAYQNEIEVNAMSTLRLNIAESLNDKLMNALKE